MEHHTITTNGIQLHVVQAGPADGPLVILLHGFPEFWYGWRRQIEHLAAAGFRVWAPDQRGYNLSEKPQGVAAYRLDTLAADVIGLMDAAGCAKAHVVGHDWGAAVAWWLANQYPDRVARLVVMNVPHHQVMERFLRGNWRQMRKSWYIFFFQLPWLPEFLNRRRNWRAATGALLGSSRRGTFTKPDLAAYREAWSQPGAFTAMINWYRAHLRHRPEAPASPRIRPPTLLIWGAQDRFLSLELAQPSIDLCDQGRLAIIQEASHWVQHEEAGQVNRLLVEFLTDDVTADPTEEWAHGTTD